MPEDGTPAHLVREMKVVREALHAQRLADGEVAHRSVVEPDAVRAARDAVHSSHHSLLERVEKRRGVSLVRLSDARVNPRPTGTPRVIASARCVTRVWSRLHPRQKHQSAHPGAEASIHGGGDNQSNQRTRIKDIDKAEKTQRKSANMGAIKFRAMRWARQRNPEQGRLPWAINWA